MFLKSHQKLRGEILRHHALPDVVLDLGFNVLHGATADMRRSLYGNDIKGMA
jgi:hypothetical protein